MKKGQRHTPETRAKIAAAVKHKVEKRDADVARAEAAKPLKFQQRRSARKERVPADAALHIQRATGRRSQRRMKA